MLTPWWWQFGKYQKTKRHSGIDLFLSGNSGTFLIFFIYLTIFSVIIFRKKDSFRYQNQFTCVYIRINLPRVCTLNSKSWDLNSKLGGCGTHFTVGLFFKFLDHKNKR